MSSSVLTCLLHLLILFLLSLGEHGSHLLIYFLKLGAHLFAGWAFTLLGLVLRGIVHCCTFGVFYYNGAFGRGVCRGHVESDTP